MPHLTLEQLREIEWAGDYYLCPVCRHDRDEGGHAPDCWRAAKIREAEEADDE